MTEHEVRPAGSEYEQAVALLARHDLLPAIAVFDLDGTIWPMTTSSHDSNSMADDVALYPCVPGILAALKHQGVQLAAVNATDRPALTATLLSKVGLSSTFMCHQLHPPAQSIGQALAAVKCKTGATLGQMVLWSGKVQNLRETAGLGVTAVRVRNGMTLTELEKGIEQYQAQAIESRGF